MHEVKIARIHPLSPLFAALLACSSATAQTTVFNQNFDGGYTGSFSTSSFQGGSPTGVSKTILTTGGNPNGCFQMTMTTTTQGDSYAEQAQLQTVSGNTDSNPADYILSFDAYGSQAANIQFLIETWQNNYFTGPQMIGATVNDQLTAANTWQTFKVNLANVTSAAPTGATWQLSFQMGAWQWGGTSQTDTVKIDNIVLTHLANNAAIHSAVNPSAYGAPVNFTVTILTNGVTAGDATGQVVFSYAGGPFSTNAVVNGAATSASISKLPVGSDPVTVVYSGGNYPSATNSLTQAVNPPPGPFSGQTNLLVYNESLVNGFQNWSWASVNLQNYTPAPTTGVYSISVTDGGGQALWLQRTAFSSAPYTSVSFWINPGAGGQKLKAWAALDNFQQPAFSLSTLTPNTWQKITLPLTALGAANKPNFTGFGIQGNSGGSQPAFYVDDIELVSAAAPVTVHLGVDAAHSLQTVDARQFGLNTATWDGILGDSRTLPLLQQIGTKTLRWPGGSTSDTYHWASDASGNAIFRNLATNLGAQVFTTINYGSGTPAEAAAWVLNANKTNHCAFKYWELGNECYGTWEYDTHALQHDPYTYATNAVACIQQMKAAFPNVPIKVGVVVVPGEGSSSNNATHFAVNPRTKTTNYGWTPIVLSVMSNMNVLPDFLIYHFYWQYTATGGWGYYSGSPDSDPLLLQVPETPSPSTWSDWASASSDLRQQITDYIGAAPGSNIELCVTENNCDAGEMGRQSTSLVNALYLADSTGQLMKTEFRSYIWWDLHNGADNAGDMDPTLYGWRSSGDYGVLDPSNSPYPIYYTEKLLQFFARSGDTVVSGSSDSPLLSAYAVRRTNGSLTMLVINKDLTTNLTGQILLTNFVPWTTATIQSYGIPQDQAAEYNQTASLQDIATASFAVPGTNFTYNFPPLSMTLFTFSPGASTLSAATALPGQLRLTLQGQPGASYIIQSSPDLKTWTLISTNTLSAAATNINLSISGAATDQFYRALWKPL